MADKLPIPPAMQAVLGKVMVQLGMQESNLDLVRQGREHQEQAVRTIAPTRKPR